MSDNPIPIDEARRRLKAAKTATTPGKAEKKRRFELERFDAIKLDPAPNYLVKGVIPRGALVVAWGPPKCGKSFLVFDLMMHVALGWKFRGRRVQGGAVVYCALEGAHGFRARVEAWRKQHQQRLDHQGDVPFYLMSAGLDLVKDRAALVASIKAELGDVKPAAVVIDTLNRGMAGDENSSEDMANFIRAADAIREAFDCAIVIVHHCGIQGVRPRGHTSLTGAVDAQIAVSRADDGAITAKIEHMKDGPEGGAIFSRLEQVELGEDDDGDKITSCIVVPVEGVAEATQKPGKLSDNDKLALDALKRAMAEHSEKPILKSGTFRVCPVEAWRSEFYAVKDGERDIQRKAFLRARERLQNACVIVTFKTYAWLAGHAGHGRDMPGHVPQTISGTDRGPLYKSVPDVPQSLSRSHDPGFRIVGSTNPGTVCVQCRRPDGEVLKLASTEPGAKPETLHLECAPKWFASDVAPASRDGG